MVEIRPATNADETRLIQMGRHFHLASGYAGLVPFDHDSALLTIRALMDGGCLLVADQDGMVVGAVGGMVAPLHFNYGIKMAAELFWWVEPCARGAGPALLDGLEAWARGQGCVLLAMIALESQRPETVGRVYARRGYVPVERTHVRTL